MKVDYKYFTPNILRALYLFHSIMKDNDRRKVIIHFDTVKSQTHKSSNLINHLQLVE